MRAAIVWVLVGSGCGAKSGLVEMEVDPCGCLARYESPILTEEQIVEIQEEARPECFTLLSESDDEGITLAHEASKCLPRVMGVDERNGLEVEVFYFCSDLCPMSGWVGVHWDVTAGECCLLGGTPMYDPAWGGYLGCSPPPLERGDACGSAS